MRDLQRHVRVNAQTPSANTHIYAHTCTMLHFLPPPLASTQLSSPLAASLSCLSLGQTGDCVSSVQNNNKNNNKQNEKNIKLGRRQWRGGLDFREKSFESELQNAGMPYTAILRYETLENGR